MLKVKILLQLFNKSKLRNGIKTSLEPKVFSIVKFKKLGLSAPLKNRPENMEIGNGSAAALLVIRLVIGRLKLNLKSWCSQLPCLTFNIKGIV